MLSPESVQNAEAQRLRFENTRWIHSRTSCAGLSVSNRNRRVVVQPGTAVGRGPCFRSGRIFKERLQRRAGLVRDPAELDAPGPYQEDTLNSAFRVW